MRAVAINEHVMPLRACSLEAGLYCRACMLLQ